MGSVRKSLYGLKDIYIYVGIFIQIVFKVNILKNEINL